MKKKLLVDLDNTGVDLISAWINIFNRRHGTNLQLANITDWDISKFVDPSKREDLWSILALPGLYRTMSPYPGFIEALKTLHYDGDVDIFITSATKEPSAAYEKMKWVFDHLPFLPKENLILTHQKFMIKADAIIDDGPHNIIDYKYAWPHALTVCIGYPYNEQAKSYSDLYLTDGWKNTEDTWNTILDYFRRVKW